MFSVQMLWLKANGLPPCLPSLGERSTRSCKIVLPPPGPRQDIHGVDGCSFGHFSPNLSTVIHSVTLPYKGRGRNFHVFGALSSELNLNTFFQLLAPCFCYAVGSCVYDHNHPYLVSERLFLAETRLFRTCGELWCTRGEFWLYFDAAAT